MTRPRLVLLGVALVFGLVGGAVLRSASADAISTSMGVPASAPLPAGAATAALQTTGNTTLATISGKLPAALGAQTVAASVAVNVASNQTVPVSAVDLPLPTGAATAARQDTGNATLTTLSGQLPPALGPQLEVNSLATTVTSGTVAATQSGTWTVQPGNTANTTAWLVTGTGGTFPVTGTFWQATQPVSGTVTANIGTVGTLATEATLSTVNTSVGTLTTLLGVSTPAGTVATITPSDVGAISCSAVWVGTGGNVYLDALTSGTNVGILAVPDGSVLPIRTTRVYATNTTASNLVCLAP